MAVEQDLDAQAIRIDQLENLINAMISILGISRQVLTQNYGVTIPEKHT